MILVEFDVCSAIFSLLAWYLWSNVGYAGVSIVRLFAAFELLALMYYLGFASWIFQSFVGTVILVSFIIGFMLLAKFLQNYPLKIRVKVLVLTFCSLVLARLVYTHIVLKMATNYTKGSSLESSPLESPVPTLCRVPVKISQTQLSEFLHEFYEAETLEYGHRNSKLKEIPEACLTNLFVMSMSLKQYRKHMVRHFIEHEEGHNSLKLVIKRYKLLPLAPLNSAIHDKRYRKAVNEEKLAAELLKMKIAGDDDLEKLDYLNGVLTSKDSEFEVPNLVHFIWFNNHTYRVIDYVCMLSALRNQKPDFLLVHGDVEPVGVLWQWLKDEAGEKLKFVKKTPPKSIFGRKLRKIGHMSDVARLHILLQVGGVYLDTDTMVLQSLNELRKQHEISLGVFSREWMANAIIVANKRSWFLRKWFFSYRDIISRTGQVSSALDVHWSMRVPMVLAQMYPSKVHVESTRLMRPNNEKTEVKHFFEGLLDLSDHLTVHLNARWMPERFRGKTIPQLAVLNTTYGEVVRRALGH